MSIAGKGPRLWLRKARRRGNGSNAVRPATWIIRDGAHQTATGCLASDRAGAERALQAYLAAKHVDRSTEEQRPASKVLVGEVLLVYKHDVVPEHARPHETNKRLDHVFKFFDGKYLSQINGHLCRKYVKSRGSPAAARRELEDLRSAINYYHEEGHVREVIKVKLPKRAPGRDRWLMRTEAAKLIRHCWRYREIQLDEQTSRFSRRHVAKFCIVGLYTGRRAGAITQASFEKSNDCGYIDVEHGTFEPKPHLKQTKKEQPKIKLPGRLLAHLRRWKASGQKHVVEWNGEPIGRMAKAFRHAARAVGLHDVTPHTLRHTAATWGMQRGADPWALAGYLGMSLETLIRRYGHHHPDHQKEGWGVFDRPGGQVRERASGHRVATGKREQTGKRGTKNRRKVLQYQRLVAV